MNSNNRNNKRKDKSSDTVDDYVFENFKKKSRERWRRWFLGEVVWCLVVQIFPLAYWRQKINNREARWIVGVFIRLWFDRWKAGKSVKVSEISICCVIQEHEIGTTDKKMLFFVFFCDWSRIVGENPSYGQVSEDISKWFSFYERSIKQKYDGVSHFELVRKMRICLTWEKSQDG